MPSFYTKKMSNFYISTYLCPSCINEPISLYKTLYNPNISLNKIVQKEEHKKIMMERIFTCPQCRSFFLSKYKEKLSENNGINLLNLNDDSYLSILEQFNIYGSAYMPQSLEEQENMDNQNRTFQFEKMVKEMRENQNRLNNSK